jgi:ATP-dependent Clp protease ATP-binding subunit ClpC
MAEKRINKQSDNSEMWDTSDELSDVLGYMIRVIGVEFALHSYTTQAFLLSVIESYDSNAYNILNKYLTNECIGRISQRLANELSLMNNGYNVSSQGYDDEFKAIMVQAEKEAEILESTFIGSEHVLLAILNKDIQFPSGGLLQKFIGYDMVKAWCLGKTVMLPQTMTQKRELPYINNTKKRQMELKSQINSLTYVVNREYTYIPKYTTNINEMVRDGKCENLVNRPKLTEKIIQVLARRKKNNVVLVGNGGVGSTSLVHLLAKLINEDKVPTVLKGKHIYMLDIVKLVSGTTLKGMFEERVNGLFEELTSSEDNILFIDNMQMVVRNTGRDKDGDLTDVLGPILSDGKVRVIGTMTFKDYRNGIENAPALSHKLQKVVVEATNDEETLEILKSNRQLYEQYHHVLFSDDCLTRAIKLAKRYITNNNLPDSAIDVIDITGARMSKNEDKVLLKLKKDLKKIDKKIRKAMDTGNFEKVEKLSKDQSGLRKDIADRERNLERENTMWTMVTEEDIDDTVSTMTDIPISKLKASDKQSILNIANILKKDVIGQDEAIEEIAKAIKRNRAGFSDKNKVYATFMLVSPTGCGKTLLAKKLAENIFGSEKALVRFDMSEYQDKTAVNKLIGSSAGYVGYDNGGLLTEAIKNKPHCVLLFDEIEKADESIYNLFLQLFDEGRLTDNNGTLVNFKNVIVIMTSNVGAKQAAERGNNVGFVNNSADLQRSIVERSMKDKFNPEFLNRIDKILFLNPLSDENLRAICKIELDKVVNRVKEEGVNITYNEDVIDYIYKKAIEQKEYGARPIMRIIQDCVSDKIVDFVLASDNKDTIYDVDVAEQEINVNLR